jgi:hypothetical protein
MNTDTLPPAPTTAVRADAYGQAIVVLLEVCSFDGSLVAAPLLRGVLSLVLGTRISRMSVVPTFTSVIAVCEVNEPRIAAESVVEQLTTLRLSGVSHVGIMGNGTTVHCFSGSADAFPDLKDVCDSLCADLERIEHMQNQYHAAARFE